MCSQEPDDGTEGSILEAFAKRAAQLRPWGKAAGELSQELGQQQVSGVAHLPRQDLAAQSQAPALPLLREGRGGGVLHLLLQALGRQLLRETSNIRL